MKILMVCLGNICRSPIAEGILKYKISKAGLTWQVDSAGTNGYHIGEAPHRLSQKVSLKNGIDISHQRSRLFVPDDFDKFDKIYAMANGVIEEMKQLGKEKFDSSKVDLFMNELKPGTNLDILDPLYGPEADYHQVYDLIEKASEAMIKNHRQPKQLIPTL